MNTSANNKMAKATSAAAPAAQKEVKKTVAKTEAKVEAPAKEVKKAAATKTEAKAVTKVEPVVVAQAVAAPAEAVNEITWNEEVKTLQTTVQSQIDSLKGVLANLKRLEKRVSREIKDARKKRKAPKLNPDGTPVPKKDQFGKQVPITDELAHFLGKAKGSTASRSEVTRFIGNYVREKSLLDKRNIKADATLLKLLAIKADEPLTYFSLQKFLNKHYIKTQ
jgi:uncharacterized protein YPO0396